MIKRALYAIAFAEQWGRQIRFIPGPRQSGKTTLARQMLDAEGSGKLYYLWDLRSVRQRYKTNELFFYSVPRKRLPAEQLSSMGALASRVVSEKFSKAKLSAQFCEFIAR